MKRRHHRHKDDDDDDSIVSKRIKTIISFVFFLVLVGIVSYGVYWFGGPSKTYDRWNDFVHFPPVTTPVDPLESLKSVASRVTEGAVSVATEIASGAVNAATQAVGGVKDVGQDVGKGVKDGIGKIGGVFGG